MNIAIQTLISDFTGAFFAVLFLQSSGDKIWHWKSELEFNKQHFAKTELRAFTPLLFVILTLLEFSSGVLSMAGLIESLFSGAGSITSFYASCLCSITLICLFFGQRIAKDYGGAQALVSYFILSLIGVYCTYH